MPKGTAKPGPQPPQLPPKPGPYKPVKPGAPPKPKPTLAENIGSLAADIAGMDAPLSKPDAWEKLHGPKPGHPALAKPKPKPDIPFKDPPKPHQAGALNMGDAAGQIALTTLLGPITPHLLPKPPPTAEGEGDTWNKPPSKPKPLTETGWSFSPGGKPGIVKPPGWKPQPKPKPGHMSPGPLLPISTTNDATRAKPGFGPAPSSTFAQTKPPTAQMKPATPKPEPISKKAMTSAQAYPPYEMRVNVKKGKKIKTAKIKHGC